jgi:hypothetical protein
VKRVPEEEFYTCPEKFFIGLQRTPLAYSNRKISLFICHAGEIRFTRIAKSFSIGVYRSDSAWPNRKVDLSIRTRQAASAYSNRKADLFIGSARGLRCLSNKKTGLSIVLFRCSQVYSNRKIFFLLYYVVLLRRCSIEKLRRCCRCRDRTVRQDE